MPTETLEMFAKEGLGLVIAVLALWWMRVDGQSRLADANEERDAAKQRESEQRADKLAMTSALTANTEAVTRLTELVKQSNDLLQRLSFPPPAKQRSTRKDTPV